MMRQCAQWSIHMISTAGPPVSPEDCKASAAGLLMISFGSSVIFSQQTAAYARWN